VIQGGEILMRLYETNRLILRELDETFALTVLNYYQRNKDFLKEWEAERPEDFFTLEYQSERLKKDIELTKSGSILKLWLFHKDDKDFLKPLVASALVILLEAFYNHVFWGISWIKMR
jgi:[ribosomal protein S5]-alanine N-acetyltransferase